MPDPELFESEFDLQFNAGMMTGHHTTEFIFDSDEGSPLPTRPDSAGADSCQTMADAPDDYGSPSEAFGLVSNSSRSMNGSQESMFDSEPSNRTRSTASTKMTSTDLSMREAPDVKTDWTMTDFLGGTSTGDFAIMPSAFEFSNASTSMQPDLRSPTDSPSPFTSTSFDDGLPVSVLASCTASSGVLTGHKSFAFNPSGPAMRPEASAGAHSYSPSVLCLRPSQSLPSPPPKYEFHGSAEGAAAAPTDLVGMLSIGNSTTGQLAAGGNFFSDSLHSPVQNPFEHRQYGPGPYRLEVGPINPKSRVETQIAIKLRLSHLPPRISKLHLPKHTISKPKLWAKPPAEPSPDMLELHAVLVCTSSMQNQEQKAAALQRAQRAAQLGRDYTGPAIDGGDNEEPKPQEGGEVRICSGCITRERKRAGRKKVKNPEDERAWIKEEARRVVVFNTHEVKDWKLQSPAEPGSRPFFHVEIPMRIACYCRHHAEKMGFQVIFTVTDHNGQLIAQAMSPSIMITDDHKTHTPPNAAAGAAAPILSPRPNMPAQNNAGVIASLDSSPGLDSGFDPQNIRRHSSGSTVVPGVPSDQLQSALAAQRQRNFSRPASPSSCPGGPTKKRRANGSVKIPSDLTMTRLETGHLSGTQLPTSTASAGPLTPATSPFPPTTPAAFPPPGDLSFFSSGTAGPEPLTNPFAHSPPSHNGSSQLFSDLGRPSGLPNLTMPLFGPPGSSRPNSASSRGGPRVASAITGGQTRTQLSQAVPNASAPPPAPAAPVIFKVIPGEGPVTGGVEVTLMGQGFYNGMHVMFGDKQSPATTFWSSESLVCLLPPSDLAGMVPVTLRGHSVQFQNTAPQLFRYVDDSEQQLLRTALMILGNKMTGGYEDVAEFARRIIKEAAHCYPSPNGEMAGGDASSSRAMDSMEGSFENRLLSVLELIDLSNTSRKPRLNLRRSTGQTMLHLACRLGLHRFVAGLLARGVHADLRDKGGYTALHFACLGNHPEIARLLIAHGADPTLRTLSGLTAADVATSPTVVRIIHRFEQHRRSQSGSVPHSRASSVISFKSIRAQVRSQAVSEASSEEESSGEESPEYSEGAFSEMADEAEGLELSGARMRRRKSSPNTPRRERSPSRPRRSDSFGAGALGSPSTAMLAFKEQVTAQLQQLQQMLVTPRLQYLPQFPQLPQLPQFPQFPQFPHFPQMPNMPPLPDYQAAVLQRLAAMVPNIGGARPESANGQPPAKDQENRWWYPSPSSIIPPPPAYSDLFPQEALDTKQASAAGAAADAEADAKCAALYDQPESSSASAERPGDVVSDEDSVQDIPALLQIGRKDAITREQQATLRRAHAANMKKQPWDRNLFLVWVRTALILT